MSNTGKKDWTAPKVQTFETAEQVWAHYGPKVRSDELLGLRRAVDRMDTVARRREEEERVARRRRA